VADVAALTVALAVLALGSVLVLVPSFRQFHEIWKRDPFSVRLVTTTVKKTTAPGKARTPPTKKVIRTTTVSPSGKTMVTTIETVPGSAKKRATSTETTTTTAEANDSLLERALSTGGLVLFRLAIVAFAAFISGAVVQRAVLGRYALKLGVLELDDLSAATTDAVAALQAAITAIGDQEKALSSHVGKRAAETKKAIAALSAQIEEIWRRLPAPDQEGLT
jgi:hypothetical protein